MSFDEYKQDVARALNEWLSALHSGTRSTAEELKESTGDLITGFKESYPRRREEIQKFVDETMEKYFKEQEKE